MHWLTTTHAIAEAVGCSIGCSSRSGPLVALETNPGFDFHRVNWLLIATRTELRPGQMTIMTQIASAEIAAQPDIAPDVLRCQVAALARIQAVEILM
jgi:hypothetical protein